MLVYTKLRFVRASTTPLPSPVEGDALAAQAWRAAGHRGLCPAVGRSLAARATHFTAVGGRLLSPLPSPITGEARSHVRAAGPAPVAQEGRDH